MRNMQRTFPLLLIAMLAISSLSLTALTVKPACAQSVPTPSVPQFTLTFQDNSYVVQPTTLTTTDPYTGKQTIVGSTIGESIANASITVRITNQPFTPYTDANNNNIQLYYNVRWKGQYTDSWEASLFPYVYVVQDSSNDYTDIPLGFTSNTFTWGDVAQINWHALGNSVNIQVEACTGYIIQTGNPPYSPLNQTFIESESSDWSNTQTIIASNVSTSPTPTSVASPTPTSTPTVPELSMLAIIPLLVGVLFVAIKLRHWKFNEKVIYD